MARRTRGRAPRVVWLPQDPDVTIDVSTLNGSTIMRTDETLIAANRGDFVTQLHPLVRDASPNPLTPANTLADINNSGYRLRRVVGKFYVNQRQLGETNAPGACVVTAAIIVLRTDPAGSTPQNPVAAAYSPADILNTEAPWVWRRTWLIANSNGTNVNNADFVPVQVPGSSNYGHLAGVADGPHIDQKTARIIGPDERLFLAITATALTAGNGQDGLGLTYIWDLRVLGSMRNTVGNRRNASR